ncbi:MAG: serpin family protein [Candidatus Aenigmatarchaeota archaeon]|nr:MAG: serpin family protein [Candidatus Aenigmarchaeota archaeon]
MDKKILTIAITILMISAVTAAAVLFLFPYQPDQPPQADDNGSTPLGIQKVVDANNQFAFELYSELNKAEDNNIFYSPYSISAALAITYEGAKGKTADEMISVFHFPKNNILRPNFAAIYNKINKNDKHYKLSAGNTLWAQYDYPFLDEYMNLVEKFYGGKAANVDFVEETEKSRQTINTFIKEQTNNKIKELIPEGVLDKMTRLVLTNAIYFKGTWKLEFDKSDTSNQNFKITSTNIVKVPMMRMEPDKTAFNYADIGELQILELPYKGEDISMLILLPSENLESIEPSLTSQKLKEYKNQMKKTKLAAIYIPKFEFDSKYFMKDTLSALGMPTAFSFGADFSGMDGTLNLYIGKVIHQAYIKVDEKGTEAAAATAVVMYEKSAAMPKDIFRADRPFIFIIQEKETENILFMGRVTDPTK